MAAATILYVALSVLSVVTQTCCTNVITITDGDSLKQHLCDTNLLPNTQLVLDEQQLTVGEQAAGEFCLVENTTNISIIASPRILSLGHSYVNVSCSNKMEETLGFGFFNVTNLTISSVVFINCKARISADALKYVNESSQFLYYSDDILVPLFFSHCCNLNLRNVSVGNNITGLPVMGLVGINLCGASEIVSLAPPGVATYPMLSVFLHFTDSNLTSTMGTCNINIMSDVISSFGGFLNRDFIQDGKDRLQISSYYSDFAVFMTQSFYVSMTIHLDLHEISMPQSNDGHVSVILMFINNVNSSLVTFQGPPYQYCLNKNNSISGQRYRSLVFVALFYETPSFNADETVGVSSALLIKNTSFTNYVTPAATGMLSIVQYTRMLSHEVTLEFVAWCENALIITFQSNLAFFPPFYARSSNYGSNGQLYLKINNVYMGRNYFADDPDGPPKKGPSCLVCFDYVKEVAMTGTNYFGENAGGGSVISIISGNLSISGELTVKDGYAFEGGGICLDGISTLSLVEPLVAKFYNNTADQGSAIYAPFRDDLVRVSTIQIVPNKRYALSNLTSIDLSLHFKNNSNGQFVRSFYAPHFGILGNQTSPNFSFKAPNLYLSLENNSWDFSRSQFAYSTLMDVILHMEDMDKFTSLCNGLCIQRRWEEWECNYIDQNLLNASFYVRPQCKFQLPDAIDLYPGQKAVSVRYVEDQIFSAGHCSPNTSYKAYSYWSSSIRRDNSTLSYTFQSKGDFDGGYYIILLSDIKIDFTSVPILQLQLNSCPIGFCSTNGTCVCDHELQSHKCSCNIDSQSVTCPPGYWMAFGESGYRDVPYARVLFGVNCPPSYCKKEVRDFHLDDDLTLSCLGNRTGVLCGECKENYSVVFGSDTCHSHCTDVYLLTLPVYILAGLLLVLLLFLLRVTVATGTINGAIFYANILGLVMDRLTEHSNSWYVDYIRVFISLLNLDLGFPLCFYEGMTTAAKVGFQFLFPTYLWSIILGLVIVSKFSVRVSRLISNSSVQVLATLFYLSFSKLLRTVIVVLSHSPIHAITGCGESYSSHVWYFDGKDYGRGIHVCLLIFALVYILLFLLPYAVLVTFSSCFARFRVVNKFKAFVDAYGGPFKDKWRFWFGLRLWITILLFGFDGALEGTDSNMMFIVQTVVIMVFVLLQVFIRPFKNSLIGLLDASFMVNYWLLIQMHLYSVFFQFGFLWVYILLTATATAFMCLILFLHIIALKYRDRLMNFIQKQRKAKRKGYEVINSSQDSDIDLFRAAEDHAVDSD